MLLHKVINHNMMLSSLALVALYTLIAMLIYNSIRHIGYTTKFPECDEYVGYQVSLTPIHRSTPYPYAYLS